MSQVRDGRGLSRGPRSAIGSCPRTPRRLPDPRAGRMPRALAKSVSEKAALQALYDDEVLERQVGLR